MKVVEILRELFDPNRALPYKWENAHRARAALPDGRALIVNFHQQDFGAFAIEFSVGDDFEITGGGEVSTIFATVIEVVKQFIKHQRMDEFGGALYFTAEEQSRAKMYDTLAKRVAKQVGWHVLPYEEMAADQRYQTAMSYGDFVFALEPGPAPKHRQAAQTPQHGEFMPIYYVYSLENTDLPAIKIKAPKAHKAEEWVIKNVPEFKNEHPMAVMAYKKPPHDRKIVDMGQVPKPAPKPPERELNPLEKALKDKLSEDGFRFIESRLGVRDQIIADVRKGGGNTDEYFVRFTSVDRLGYSAKQTFARTPDADDPKFDANYIGAGKGRPALWFYPLDFYLKQKDAYATDKPYVWLVRINPDAWLQPIKDNTKGIQPAPQGKERVGLMRLTMTPAAIFFKPAFDVVGKYYDYAGQHQRHGQVKGPEEPSWFDKIRGYK